MFPLFILEGRAPRTSECLGAHTFREVGSMKSLRLLALCLFAFACTSSAVLACEAHKSATTAKAGSTTTTNAVVASTNGQVPAVTAEGGCAAHAMSTTGTQCTAAMKAVCDHDAAAAAAMGCSAKGATATTASTASATPGAGKGSCAAHSRTAVAGSDHCAGAKSASATFAAAGAGMKCADHMNGVAHDCTACLDWIELDQDVRALGARSQVVALKNGAMIVYTADSPAAIKQLQLLVAKRNERMTAAFAGNSDAKLCDDCKHLRGAIASGKLNREVVNVERGVLALVTSNDQAVVQRIRTMTGQPIAM